MPIYAYSIRFLDRTRLQATFEACTKIAARAAIRIVQAGNDRSALSRVVDAIAADAARVV